jgi:hypothetical protein
VPRTGCRAWFFEITDDEMAAVDGYEVDYWRVPIRLASGVDAWAYASKDDGNDVLTNSDLWLRPEPTRSALLVIDARGDFIEGGASPIPGHSGGVASDRTVAGRISGVRAFDRARGQALHR